MSQQQDIPEADRSSGMWLGEIRPIVRELLEHIAEHPETWNCNHRSFELYLFKRGVEDRCITVRPGVFLGTLDTSTDVGIIRTRLNFTENRAVLKAARIVRDFDRRKKIDDDQRRERQVAEAIRKHIEPKEPLRAAVQRATRENPFDVSIQQPD